MTRRPSDDLTRTDVMFGVCVKCSRYGLISKTVNTVLETERVCLRETTEKAGIFHQIVQYRPDYCKRVEQRRDARKKATRRRRNRAIVNKLARRSDAS